MPVIMIGKEEYDFLNSQRKRLTGKLETFASVVKRLIEQEKKR